jgi:hypothetical protein
MQVNQMVKNEKKNKNKKFVNSIEKDLKARKDGDINKYYQKIGDRLKKLKVAFLAALVVLVCGGLVFRSEELTLENIAYLWRYMDIIPSGRAETHEFKIETDDNSLYGYYRNNITVLRRNRLDIYDTTGRRNSTFYLAYSNPALSVSSRYILTYDLGMNKLDIFNPSKQVYEYIGENPIFGARVTDKGFVVYVTKETGYMSVVKILNNNFAEIYAAYRVNDIIMDADIDEGGKYLAAAGHSADGGDMLTSIILYKTDSEEAVREIKIRGEMAYELKMNDSGFCVVLDSSVRFYDLDGLESAYYNLAGRTIQATELGADFSAVILNEKTLGSNSRILIFDKHGNIVCEQLENAEIMDIKFSAEYNYLYYLTRTGIYKITVAEDISELFISRMNGDLQAEYDETTRRIVFANEKNIYLAGFAKVNILKN